MTFDGNADLALFLPETGGGVSRGWRTWVVGAKQALICGEPGVFFTTPHFDS